MPRLPPADRQRLKELLIAYPDQPASWFQAQVPGLTLEGIRQHRLKLQNLASPQARAIAKAKVANKLAKVAKDTIVDRRTLLDRCDETLAKIAIRVEDGAVVVDDVRALVGTIAEMRKLLESIDKAKVMGLNALGMDEEALRVETMALLERVKEKLTPGARDELMRALADERMREEKC